MAMGIDQSRDENAVEKFNPLAGVDGFPCRDLNHPSLSVEREYPVLQPALRSQDQVRR